MTFRHIRHLSLKPSPELYICFHLGVCDRLTQGPFGRVTGRCAYDIFPGTPRPPPCTPPLPTTQARAGTCRNPPRSRMFYDGLDCVPGYERYRNSGSRGFKQVDKYEQDRSSFIVHIR
mmetsp:Transcript_16769/g.45676  ORF Transcript_16769/g.45676 Transcript_16769/m.45676 type:complete len:118 (-) Transcript_16769:226-579(-)